MTHFDLLMRESWMLLIWFDVCVLNHGRITLCLESFESVSIIFVGFALEIIVILRGD